MMNTTIIRGLTVAACVSVGIGSMVASAPVFAASSGLDAADWANSQLGYNPAYTGMCLAFAYDAWGNGSWPGGAGNLPNQWPTFNQLGLAQVGPFTANDFALWLKSRGALHQKLSSLAQAPMGALVFFGPSGANTFEGHVGILTEPGTVPDPTYSSAGWPTQMYGPLAWVESHHVFNGSPPFGTSADAPYIGWAFPQGNSWLPSDTSITPVLPGIRWNMTNPGEVSWTLLNWPSGLHGWSQTWNQIAPSSQPQFTNPIFNRKGYLPTTGQEAGSQVYLTFDFDNGTQLTAQSPALSFTGSASPAPNPGVVFPSNPVPVPPIFAYPTGWANGAFIRNENTGEEALVYDDTQFAIPGPAASIYDDFGVFNPTSYVNEPDTVFGTLPTVPPNGFFMRNPETGAESIVFAGAAFHIPSPAEYTLFGVGAQGAGAVSVPAGVRQEIPTADPINGSFLRNEVTGQEYSWQNGILYYIPSARLYSSFGIVNGSGFVNVPPGIFSELPIARN